MSEQENKKDCAMKVIGMLLAAFIGAFLAIYVVADMTLHHMMRRPHYDMFSKNMRNVEHAIKQQEREFNKMSRDFDIFMPPVGMNLVDVKKQGDVYKFTVSLKPFNNDENNISLRVEGQNLTISGSSEKIKNHKDMITQFSQTFLLDDAVNIEKIEKEKQGNKLKITVPLKD